ncbi:glycosyltransferase family 2 protein [Phenylobacterium aquaticum]|uniref:glycosyltransferase family 2 protein n=1 Tax=Phenylobacterium aquaticum TaxID=1763816 RepID=UPI001F5D9CF7|nr:glycosyltransferase family 2 protein [Phenylobacterium aquaticum]
MATAAPPLRRTAARRLGDPRPADPRLDEAGVWIVIPCYKVTDHIARVIAKIPAWVEGVVCVDDACPDGSGDFIAAEITDPRVRLVRLPENQGVGGATLAGYAEADRLGGRILVKVDGDDQMDLSYLGQLVAPILLGEADYTKGNRFTSVSHLQSMPRVRIFGNAALSFAAKVSTGYWNIFDPTNGFTAIEASVARRLMDRRVSRRFFFETDLLYHLGALRAVVRDVPIPARYGSEVSNLRISAIVGPFALKHVQNFIQRILGQYFVRDFNVATLEMLSGGALILFGLSYALHWLMVRVPGHAASAGVVMAAALPVIVGVQLMLQAMNFDVMNAPTRPIHPSLRALERLEAD